MYIINVDFSIRDKMQEPSTILQNMSAPGMAAEYIRAALSPAK